MLALPARVDPAQLLRVLQLMRDASFKDGGRRRHLSRLFHLLPPATQDDSAEFRRIRAELLVS